MWKPTPAQRDLRQLVPHRHRLVRMRTRVKNQLHAVALNEAVPRRPGLWTWKGRRKSEALTLPSSATVRGSPFPPQSLIIWM